MRTHTPRERERERERVPCKVADFVGCERESSGFSAHSEQHGTVSTARKFACTALITAAFLLTACGGGGGGSSGGDGGDKCETGTLALCTIDASFPAFDEKGLAVDHVNSNKDYSPVSPELNASFVANLIKTIPYSGSSAPGYDEYEKNDIRTGVDAYVRIQPDYIELYLDSSSNIVHTDAQFEEVYGTIKTDVVYVSRFITYSGGDFAKAFSDYNATLVNKHIMNDSDCSYDTSSSQWSCTKTVGNLIYYWGASSDGGFAEWSVW